jgi:hypothetical protein
VPTVHMRPKLTPREYLNDVVRPNLEELEAEFASIRRANNAVSSVDALAAHLFEWCKANAPHEVGSARDDTAFRENLAKRSESFRLIRDIAKAHKHVRLTRGSPLVSAAAQTNVRSLGWGEAAWDEGRWDGPPQVVVTLDDGTHRVVDAVARQAVAFLEAEMARLGV